MGKKCCWGCNCHLLSYNVKGLNSIKKQLLALKDFRTFGVDMILIQETHFCAGGSLKYASKHFAVYYMASDSSGKAGIAMFVRHSCPLQIKSSHLDPHGQYLILQCVFMFSPITLLRFSKPFKLWVEISMLVFLLQGIWDLYSKLRCLSHCNH